MEISIDIAELRKRKIMICTPMFGGMCSGTYTKSCTDLATMTANYGIEIRFYYIFNESLIPRARNYLADEFLRSECTHMMFIDADIGFNPEDVLSLVALAEPGSDFEIVCGPYPKKTIAWEKIKMAVDKGFADDDPSELNRFVGDYVFNPVKGKEQIRLDQPAEVLEGGTGFMMIQRSALEKYQVAYPQQMYKPDHIRTDAFDGTREIMAFFDCVIDPKSRRYLSEDYMFCQWSIAAGMKIWMCPWMRMTHMGSYMFGGCLEDLAQLGAPATADMNEMQRQKNVRKAKRNVPGPTAQKGKVGKRNKGKKKEKR